MKFKKFIGIIITLFIIFSNNSFANDNFIDNNAKSFILKDNKELSIVVSEYNTSKIITKENENKIFPYKNLSAKILIFILSEKLRDKKINFDTKVELVEKDDVTESLKLNNDFLIKDSIFILEQNPSNAIIKSIINKFDITISDFQKTLDKLTMRDTELNSLEITTDNKTTAKNLSYLTEVTLKNYPKITDLTKNPKYNLANEEEIDNNIEFIESENIRSLGMSFYDNNSITVAYSGNTKIIVTALNISQEKTDFFNSLQELYKYIFENYQYKLALKSGTYDINNENITIKEDIYDLFYKNHSEKDIKYFLMNHKILFFQNYSYLSDNASVVFAEYINTKNKSNIEKIKETFIQDNKFNEKNNDEKIKLILNRIQYFLTFVLLIYTTIFLIIFFIRKPFAKGD